MFTHVHVHVRWSWNTNSLIFQFDRTKKSLHMKYIEISGRHAGHNPLASGATKSGDPTAVARRSIGVLCLNTRVRQVHLKRNPRSLNQTKRWYCKLIWIEMIFELFRNSSFWSHWLKLFKMPRNMFLESPKSVILTSGLLWSKDPKATEKSPNSHEWLHMTLWLRCISTAWFQNFIWRSHHLWFCFSWYLRLVILRHWGWIVCICIGDAHRLGHKQICQVTSKTKTIREVKQVPCWNDNADTATSCTSDGIGKFFSWGPGYA